MGFDVSLQGKAESVYKQSTTKTRMLGTRWALEDGRVYHYAQAGGAITIGRVVGHIAKPSAFITDVTPSTATPRTTAQWDSGTRTISIATTASATTSIHVWPNRYDDGYMWVTDQAGEGQMLQVKSHAVSTSVADTDVAFTIYDEELLTVALTTATQFGLCENLYKNVVIHTGTTAGGPALGVAPRAVTSAYYFWLQTWGLCPVKNGSVLPLAGEAVRVINSTGGDTALTGVAGSIYPAGATKLINNLATAYRNPVIGYCVAPAVADADYSLVYLTIAP